jgi:hypothetical protein
MPRQLPEMIELLITEGRTASGRNFVKAMDQFVQRMPMIHATNKAEFFIAYFLGGIYNFEYTQLKNDLRVTSSSWKYDRDTKTLDLVFEIKNQENNVNHLVFRSIAILAPEGSPYAGKITSERPYSSLAFKDAMLAELAYKNPEHEGGLRFTERFYQTRFSAQPNSDSSAQIRAKLIDFGFERISPVDNIQGIDERDIKKFGLDEVAVKNALEVYLKGNVNLFEKAKNIFSEKIVDSIKTEAFSHGFLYGSLSLNFKNRFLLDCYVERVAGNGYADLVMISRVNRRSSGVPIIIELKAGTATARDAINQIEKIGYFQHELSLRTYHDKAVIAGVNFNLASELGQAAREEITTRGDAIAVSEASISSENNIIGRILTTSNGVSDYSVKQQEIQKNLLHLYYSRLDRLSFRSLVSLLVGYVLSFEGVNDLQDVSKHLFLPSEGNNNLNHQAALLAIDFKDKNIKKTVIFVLSAKKGAKTRSQIAAPDNSITTALNFCCTERQNQQSEVQKISIRIDPTKTATDFFSSIRLETINLIAFNQVTTIAQLKGELHELKTLTLTDFFQPKSRGSKEFIFSSQLKDKLKAALFPLRGLFQGSVDTQQKEFYFQAMMQGITSGLNKETYQVRTFAEPNYSAQGRADLVVTLASLNEQKKMLAESVFILEFKALFSSNKLQTNADSAFKQAEKYVENVKSLTDAREVAVMGLVMNSHAERENNFLAEKSDIATVDHFSTDEQMSSPERSPNKRKHPDRDESPVRAPAKRQRCRRSAGTSCRVDFSVQDSEELIIELAEARKKGHVILLADSYALLLGFLEVENPVGKIVILDESIENLNRVAAIVALASQSATLDIWLDEVQRIFPKEANILARGIEQLGDRIDFDEFKAMLARHDLRWAKINKFSTSQTNRDSFRQRLGILDETIAAIYLGDYEDRILGGGDSEFSLLKRDMFKTQILSLLSSDESVELYRRTAPNERVITFYSGPKSYLEQEWQVADLMSLSSSDRQQETLLSLKIAQEWSHAMEKTESVSRDWIPILETAQETVSGNEQMHFINPKMRDVRTDVRTIALSGLSSSMLREDLNLLYERIAEAVPAEVGMSESLSASMESAESIDGLNAAFTVQAVFDFMKQKDRAPFQTERGTLYTAIQIHHYLALAQMAHGTVMDVNKVVDIVKTLLRDEINLTEKPLSSLRLGLKQGASEGLGVLFGAASVILDSVELSNAKTAAEKATFGTQLAFDGGGLSLSLAGMGAAYTGASVAATMLGAGTVILSGLGIGISALVQAFNQVVKEAEVVGDYFYQLDAAYQQRGYEEKQFSARNQSMMNPLYGAVVTEINFINDTMVYGSPYIYPAPHWGGGSGKINYLIWFGTTPRVIRDKQRAINIRERLAYTEKSTLGNWKTVSSWILPATPISYIDYDWMTLPGATLRRDNGFSVLRKLEQQGNFHYDFYVFPSEFIINTIREERVATQIKIILDAQERTLIVPHFSEHDREIYKNIHYQIESPARAGRCSIVLNRVGSLTLNNQHPEYTWVLITEDQSADTLKFTATGIEIDNIPLVLTSPRAGRYTFVDKQRTAFSIDWPTRRLLLSEINLQSFHNGTLGLRSYLQNSPADTTVLIHEFPIQDHQGITYKGRAYYLAQEDRYLYTTAIPEPINVDSDLVECVANDCYFISPPGLFWRSDRQTHQLQEKYLLYSDSLGNFVRNKTSDSLDGKGQIVSAAVEMDGNVRILQVFKNEQGKTVQSVRYHLVQDKLILSAIADDELLQILVDIEDEARLIAYLDSIFNQQADQSSRWDDYPQLSARTIAAEIDRIVAIAPLSEPITFNLIWLRQQDKGRYQLINPRVNEQQLHLLGSLLAADGRDVFYFLCPGQANTPAQLFRQSEEMAVAEPLDLSITQAYFAQGILFILTSENIIKKLDVSGETSIVSFNAEWTRRNQADWWEKIPALLVAENHQAKDPITLYGLSDLSGNVLAAWYDPRQPSFVVMRPPSKPNGEQFQVSYLGHLAGMDYFFAGTGELYQQASCLDSIPAYFQTTQLQKELPSLVTVADSLQAAYLQAQRLYVHQNGLIFSFDPRLPKTWCLEKVEKPWFENKQQDESFWKDKTRFLQSFQSKLMANYESDFFSINGPFITMDFSNRTRPFVSRRKNALIAIEYIKDVNTWWNPDENRFFCDAFQEDSSDWRYLGVCSGKNDAQGICFFSPKAKMIYFNPDYEANRVYFTTDSLRRYKFPAELAIVYRTIFLLVLHITANSSEYFIPLLRDQKNLNLYLSSQVDYTFDVSKEVMNHYQVSFYQFSDFSLKKLNFLLEGQVKYQKSGQDIILSSPSVSGQWTFLQGMLDKTWDTTRLNVSYNAGNKTRSFLFSRIRTYLLNGHEKSIPLGRDAVIYSHQDLHRHEVEISNFSETRMAVSTKTQPVSPWLIFSSLSVLLGILASGFGAIFIRRFRQTRSATLAERGLESAVSLLPLLDKLKVVEANSVVDCHRQEFFTPEQCLQNESAMGLLGYCDNGQEALLWLKNSHTSTEAADLLWYALAQHRKPSALNATLNWQATHLSVDSDYLYLDPQDACRQAIELKAIKPIPMSVMFSYLPNQAKRWLQTKWAHEQSVQAQALQDAAAHSMAKRLAMQIGLNYLAGEGLLHTSVGDYFQHVGLKPNWQDHDHRYYIARCLSAGQQLLLGDPLQSHRISTMAAVGLETVLLHPKLQTLYFDRSSNPRYAKQVIRFLADLLQFGRYHWATLPSVLELLFSDYAPIHSIALGLRALLSFVSISNDPGYYYLGIALFLLPQLPLLLEHLGIPVTHYVSQTLEKWTQFFIFQSLIVQFMLMPDPERLAEREREQIAAEQRVVQGRQRLSRVVQPVVGFFNPTTRHDVDAQDAHGVSPNRISRA